MNKHCLRAHEAARPSSPCALVTAVIPGEQSGTSSYYLERFETSLNRVSFVGYSFYYRFVYFQRNSSAHWRFEICSNLCMYFILRKRTSPVKGTHIALFRDKLEEHAKKCTHKWPLSSRFGKCVICVYLYKVSALTWRIRIRNKEIGIWSMQYRLCIANAYEHIGKLGS